MDGITTYFILFRMRPDEQKYEEEHSRALERLIEHDRKVVAREPGNNSEVPKHRQVNNEPRIHWNVTNGDDAGCWKL